MLSRTAEHLYWMSRQFERAENVARFLDVANRLSLSGGDRDNCWRPVLTIAGGEQGFADLEGSVTAPRVVSYAVLNQNNGSSILGCLKAARENAHAVRSTIPSELWETINATWLEARTITGAKLREQGLVGFCDWIKERAQLFRGSADSIMVRNEPFQFVRLGSFIERGDNTARLLGVRAAGVTAASETCDPADQIHWAAVLQSVSAYKAYRSLYRDTVSPAGVADMLILRDAMPRSLHNCMDRVCTILEQLCPSYECARMAGAAHAELHFARLDNLLADGLDSFVERFITTNNALGNQIHADFLMGG